MVKQLLVLCLSAFVLAGCSTKWVSVDHFGGQPKFDEVYSKPDTPILIAEYGTFSPNSAGGVDFDVQILNSSSKAIKYITFWTTPYNRVNDRVVDRVSGKSTKRADYTGPLNPGSTNTAHASFGETRTMGLWKNMWYNHSVECSTIDKVDIEYMDGEKITVTNTDSLMTRKGRCRSYKQR